MKIYILTRNPALYSSRRIIEAASYRGHDIRPVDYMQCQLLVKRNGLVVKYQGSELPKVDMIIPRIAANCTAFGSALVRQFELMGCETPVTSSALLNSRNKFDCLQYLSSNGIKVPVTSYSAKNHHSSDAISAVGGAPFIIKTIQGTQGMGVVLQKDREHAQSTLDAFQALNAKIIVQEFIKESSGVDIRVIVAGDKVIAAMKRKAPKGEFRSNIHRGGVGLPIELNEEQKNTAIQAAKILGLEIAGVDMLVSNEGSLVLEINSSPGIEGIEECTKLDVAQGMMKHLEQMLHNSKIK